MSMSTDNFARGVLCKFCVYILHFLQIIYFALRLLRCIIVEDCDWAFQLQGEIYSFINILVSIALFIFSVFSYVFSVFLIIISTNTLWRVYFLVNKYDI